MLKEKHGALPSWHGWCDTHHQPLPRAFAPHPPPLSRVCFFLGLYPPRVFCLFPFCMSKPFFSLQDPTLLSPFSLLRHVGSSHETINVTPHPPEGSPGPSATTTRTATTKPTGLSTTPTGLSAGRGCFTSRWGRARGLWASPSQPRSPGPRSRWSSALPSGGK